MSQTIVSPRDAAIIGYLQESKGNGLGARKLMRSMAQSSRAIAEHAIAGRLTERERKVLQLICEGDKVADISKKLNISPKTVSVYRERIREKFSLTRSDKLTRLARSVDTVSIGRVELGAHH